ncbi:MAG: RHS repeat-associated core domain-containing protein [Pyrinomonadaceae bacterium]
MTIFVYDAAGKLVAEYSTIVASTNDAKVAYLTNDHLGSPRINTDKNGNVTARHDYHPFGEEIATSQRIAELDYESDTVRKQFTGYERDEETGSDFAEARYYTNALGRFSSTDPENYGAAVLDPQTWNGYAYVINNPSNFVDPDGLEYLICPTDGSRCYTHDDDLVRKAKKVGEYNWVGSRNSKTGLDSGTIQDAGGNVIATYQQTSHDSQIQQMLWGSQPTLQVWKPVVDNVFTGMVSGGAIPVASAAAPATSVVRTAAPGAAQTAKNAQLAFNGAKGAIGEAIALAKLAADGVEVVGTRVSAKLASGGRRVIDILVKVGDEVVAIEVKTGGARRGAAQVTKDAEMLSNGATLVGQNAGGLSGQVYQTIRTIVLTLP